MSNFDPGNLNVEDVRCVVCEKMITGGNWFARVKHGERTVVLCCSQCAEKFHATPQAYIQPLTTLAMFRSPQVPYQGEFCPLNDY